MVLGVYGYIYKYIYIYVCIHICKKISTYIYMYIYIHIGDLDGARYLWRRLPEDFKCDQTEIFKIWSIGKV
jgi:hypothetical protein